MSLERLYSRVILTPLLDLIFITLFIYMGSVADKEEQNTDRVRSIERERGDLVIKASQADKLVLVVTSLKELQTRTEKKLAVAEERTARALAAAEERRKSEVAAIEERNAALIAQLADVKVKAENPHRTMAAAQVFDQKFDAYEARVQPAHWVEIKKAREGSPQRVQLLSGPQDAQYEAELQRLSQAGELEKLRELRAKIRESMERSATELLGRVIPPLADKSRTILLLLIDPKATLEDVRVLQAVVRKAGWIHHEYVIPQ